MPVIFGARRTEDGRPVIEVYDPDRRAKVGRWCRPPDVPDLCYTCFDPKTLAHYPAEGFREEVDSDGTVWRVGTCHRCAGKPKSQRKTRTPKTSPQGKTKKTPGPDQISRDFFDTWIRIRSRALRGEDKVKWDSLPYEEKCAFIAQALEKALESAAKRKGVDKGKQGSRR